mmetsp:Transcript_15017/g.42423  ORF Transcript_15017/g.42423 Transcript_15017/m.42423 type:complete len:89 (+) Transcript_15017:154-420(+)
MEVGGTELKDRQEARSYRGCHKPAAISMTTKNEDEDEDDEERARRGGERTSTTAVGVRINHPPNTRNRKDDMQSTRIFQCSATLVMAR